MNYNITVCRPSFCVSVALLLVIQGCATTLTPHPRAIDYVVAESITIGGPGGWDFVTFDPSRQRLFIARADRVQVWSADSKRVVGEIPGTPGVHGAALAQDLKRGFTSNGRANTVTVFGLDDLQVMETIDIPGQNPDAILYEPNLKRVYTFNGRSADVTVIDATTLKVVATIPVGGKPEGAVSDGSGHIFVNIEDTAELAIIDAAANKVQFRRTLAPCTNPTGLAIDKSHYRLFSVCDKHKMVILDPRSGRQVAILPIGGEPDGAEYDAGLGLAFSATPAPTAEQPRPRPPMIPDSFAVIVVAPR